MRTKTALHEAILTKLEGSSSQNPVNTAKLYPLGTRKQVEAALTELYQARNIACCKITRRGEESIVWWTVMQSSTQSFNFNKMGEL